MDPAWISIAIGLGGSLVGGLITGLCAFFGLRTWVARLEERQKSLIERAEEDRALARQAKEVHDKRLATHELEIGRLKWNTGAGRG